MMNLKALIVEDDPILQTLHQKALKSLPIESTIAGTGIEAIQDLKNSIFDFVLMDINMPDQDGLDAAVGSGVKKRFKTGMSSYLRLQAFLPLRIPRKFFRLV